MLEIKDIEKLAKLARIELSEAEKELYLKEIESILSYVDQIKEVVSSVGGERKIPEQRNVFRVDEVLNESHSNTEAIVNEFPNKEENRLKVKKILAN